MIARIAEHKQTHDALAADAHKGRKRAHARGPPPPASRLSDSSKSPRSLTRASSPHRSARGWLSTLGHWD